MRKKLYQFYQNLIDDIKDEDIREKMLDRLEEIDDEIFELDYDVRARIEIQEEYEECETQEEQEKEFLYANRMC